MVRVLLPADHAWSGRQYPVVLLLHGIGGTARAWTTCQDGWPTSLERFTEDKDVIVVMPDGGQHDDAGWYCDWWNDGARGAPAWESYHLGQLLELVDRTFPTRTDRGGRVVAGLSMGGYGAMSYAARHPDLFAGAFSFSGALDTRQLGAIFDPRLWGSGIRRRGHNPVDLADNLADTRVWFRTGQGLEGGPGILDDETLDLEAFLLPTNDSFAAALRAAGVDHRYEAYPAGGHNWYHWHDGFSRAWPEMKALFDRPSVPPASFRYRSIEARFSIWGWDVSVDRPDAEFLQLHDVSATGLTLEGGGAVTLTTPPAHQPGRAFALSAYGLGTSVAPSQVRADDDGRFRFAVTLNPPRTRVADVRIAARPF